MTTSTVYLLVILAYFAFILIMSVILGKRIKSTDDMYLAKGQIGPAAIGFSVAATHMSASSYSSFIGLSGAIGYNCAAPCLGSAAFPWFSFVLLGDRVRKISSRVKSVTLADLIEARYGSTTGIVSMIIMILCTFFIVGAQVQAGATSFNAVLGLPYITSVIVFALVIIIHTMVGGMFAVAYSDLIQGIIMMASLVVLVPLTVSACGGFSAMNASYAAMNPTAMDLYGIKPITWVLGAMFTWGILQVGGQPGAATRFMIPADDKTLRKSMIYASLCEAVIYCLVLLTGISAWVLLKGECSNTDQLIFVLIQKQFPPIIGGIVVAACIGAMLSTVDSALLFVSSLIVNNFYVRLRHKEPDSKRSILISRLVTLGMGLISVIIALDPPDIVTFVVTMGLNLMSAAFFAPLVLGFWWPRANKAGGLAGVISGFAGALAWYAVSIVKYGSLSTFMFGIWPSFVGAGISLIVTIAVSLATQPPEDEVINTFFSDIIIAD